MLFANNLVEEGRIRLRPMGGQQALTEQNVV